MKNTLPLVWIASLSLLGCAAPSKVPGPLDADAPKVTATVAGGVLTASPPTLVIPATNRKAIEIHLDATGYTFDPTDGITFWSLFSPGSDLDCRINPRVIVCKNMKQPGGMSHWYKYTLKVIDGSGGSLSHDPWINNQ